MSYLEQNNMMLSSKSCLVGQNHAMFGIFIFVGALCTASIIFANEQTIEGTGNGFSAKEERVLPNTDLGKTDSHVQEKTTNNFMDKAHSGVSYGVVSTAQWIDSFFKTERFEEEDNKTSLRFRFDNFFDEDGNEFKARVKVRLKTPNLNKRLKFFVVGEEGDVNSSLSLDEQVAQVFEGTNEDNISVGLLYQYRETARKNIKLKSGVRVRDNKLIFFVEPRFRWSENFNNWDFYFSQKVGWFSDNGFNINTLFNFDRPLAEGKLFRTIVAGDGYEDIDTYFYNINFVYSHLLSDHKGLSYQWINAFVLYAGSKLKETTVKVAYRQNLWRDWLILEVSPQVKYPRLHDFEARPGLFIRLEMKFEQIKRK